MRDSDGSGQIRTCSAGSSFSLIYIVLCVHVLSCIYCCDWVDSG